MQGDEPTDSNRPQRGSVAGGEESGKYEGWFYE